MLFLKNKKEIKLCESTIKKLISICKKENLKFHRTAMFKKEYLKGILVRQGKGKGKLISTSEYINKDHYLISCTNNKINKLKLLKINRILKNKFIIYEFKN